MLAQNTQKIYFTVFLVLEFDLKSSSTLLGPNDPKKVKKL